MAKPGSREAAELSRMARQAHDLADQKIPEHIAEKLCAAQELKESMRCAGCGERIGVGFRFTRIEAFVHPKTNEPMAATMHVGACDGAAGCDFAREASKGSTAMEVVEYVWMDGLGQPPQPPADGEAAEAVDDPDEAVGDLPDEALAARHEAAGTAEEQAAIRGEMIRRGLDLPPAREFPAAEEAPEAAAAVE